MSRMPEPDENQVPGILIVEDETVVALDIRKKLQGMGYTILGISETGHSALEAMQQKSPDLVIMDVRLRGDMDGIDTALIIQKDYGVPVVYITGHSDASTLNRIQESRPFGFLLKPFDAKELHTVIQIALNRHNLEQDLSASEFRNRLLFELASDGILIADQHGVVQRANARISDLTGLPKTDLLGRFFWEPFEVDTDSLAVDRGKVRFVETVHRPPEGPPTPVELSISILPGGMIQVLVRDLRNQKKGQEQMQLLARVFDSLVEGVFVADRERNLVACNGAFMASMGYGLPEIQGQSVALFRSDVHPREFYVSLWRDLQKNGKWEGEITVRKKSGEEEQEWASLSAIRDDRGHISHFVGIFIDLTERKRYEDRLYYLAHHDSLTDLPNRSLFGQRLDRALIRAQRNGQRFALFFMDLDRFKHINDSYGHDAGDRLLIETAERLRRTLRKGDTVSRFGGDEFNILVEDIRETEDVTVVADKVLKALEEPIQVGGKFERVSPSIGIAIYPEDGLTGQELLECADRSMYRAKGDGGARYRFTSKKMNLKSLERELLYSGLEQGLERGEFLVRYGKVLGLDNAHSQALQVGLFWNHPDLGLLSSARFQKVLEESPVASAFHRNTMQQLLSDLKKWKGMGQHLPLVLLSAQAGCIASEQFLEIIEGEESDLEGLENLALEMGEPELREMVDSHGHCMEVLEGKGVKVSVRDPGTGYLSLQELNRLPLAMLKVGAERVHRISENPLERSVFQITVGMAHSLKVPCIAEGVHSQALLALLEDLGCDGYQGSLTGVPMDASEVSGFLRESPPEPKPE
ncbi:MAG: diguanylate cyclase [Leptospiraceae bacterium]|nr:diguanylate cyclase [Leptospiraceae bacterium]